jgi:hypothetical protein
MARSLLFVAWSLVLWGSFVTMASLWVAGTEGISAAWLALVPRRPGLWDWLNLVAVVLAVAVWACVAFTMIRLRQSDRASTGSDGADPIA